MSVSFQKNLLFTVFPIRIDFMRIRIQPAFSVNADPDADPGLIMNADPDPG
jgi:hypothetical protein